MTAVLLHRCQVCHGIVWPFHKDPAEPCQLDCRHRPDAHAACFAYGWTGVVYGPSLDELPDGYTASDGICANCHGEANQTDEVCSHCDWPDPLGRRGM
jgi:hypothetical protein